MKLHYCLLLILLCAAERASAQQTANSVTLQWSELLPLSDPLGVAGPFVGVHRGALIVAGGANFPQPVWENDKQWHDAIYVLTSDLRETVRHVARPLPRPIAYGASVSTPEGVVCMGGNDAERTYSDVFLLQWDAPRNQVTTVAYPSLPKPCAYGAATLVGDVIYLAGGQSSAALDSAMTNFWTLDLSQKDDAEKFRWQTLEPWPGSSRAFNLTLSQHNGEHEAVYVISGRRQRNDASPQFLKDVWEYTVATGKWRQRADVPRCVMAGTGIDVGQHTLLVLSGADGSLFTRSDELRDTHPGFPKQALAYDTISNTWTDAGSTPANHVTTTAVEWNGAIIIPSGEVRPRVRSPKVWCVRMKEHH